MSARVAGEFWEADEAPLREDRLSVLHVITRMALGGSEQRLIDAVNAVPSANVTVIAGDLSGLKQVSKRMERMPQMLTLNALTRDPNPIRDAFVVQRLRHLILDIKPDIVHTHQSKAGVLGRLAAVGTNRSVVHSSSMASFGSGYSRTASTVFRILELATAPLVDRYAVVGHDLARRLTKAGIPSRKLEIVRSSLDLAPFVAVRGRRRNADGESLRLLFAGALEERKGVRLLPRFASKLAGLSKERVCLRVAGDGPLRQELEALSATVPRGVRVKLIGYRSDLATLMSESDLVVLPSSSEGMPQVLIQAAAAGVPFAAFAVDGTGELLQMGASGVTAPLKDIEELACRANDLLQHNASRAVDPLSFSAWEYPIVRKAYREIYAQVLDARRGQTHNGYAYEP